MSYIFISYTQEDGDFAYQLRGRIEEAGFDTWMDKNRVRPGADWGKEIDRGIRKSLAMMVVMSPEAKASEYVTYEWSFAVGAGIPVVPIMYKQTILHPRLSRYQHLTFTNHSVRPWDQLSDEINKINTLQKEEAERLRNCKDDLVNYPCGPKVEITCLPHSFTHDVADEFYDPNLIRALVDTANDFRDTVESGHSNPKRVIRQGVLPMNGSAYDAWRTIFDEARLKGPRMLAAILMVLRIRKHKQLYQERDDVLARLKTLYR